MTPGAACAKAATIAGSSGAAGSWRLAKTRVEVGIVERPLDDGPLASASRELLK